MISSIVWAIVLVNATAWSIVLAIAVTVGWLVYQGLEVIKKLTIERRNIRDND